MQWQANPGQMADEWAIRRLALLYARAVDRNQPEIFDAIFTADAVLDIAGDLRRGERLRQTPAGAAKKWVATLHKIHNQLVTVHGDSAEGETYCTAEHLEKDSGGGTTLLSMSIRYQDNLARQDGQWRYRHRRLIIEWTDVRQVVWKNAPA